MTDLIYPKLSYVVQGCLYDAYNELRYLELSEEGWENACLIALAERGVSAQRQVEYELRYKPIERRETRLLIVDDKVPLHPSLFARSHPGSFVVIFAVPQTKTQGRKHQSKEQRA